MPASYDVRIDWDGDGGLTRLGDWDQWIGGGTVSPAVATSTVRSFSGADSLLITWGAGGTFPLAGMLYDGLTVGVTYTVRGWVWVPTGSIDVLWVVAGVTVGSASTVNDAWQEISVTFTATSAIHFPQIWPNGSPAGGEQVWLDEPTIQIAEEDVTARVLDRSGISIKYGRDRARVLSPMAPGEADFELNNTSRDYSPDNTSSPLSGNVLPGREVRINATLSTVDYGLFRGHLDDFTVLPEIGRRSVEVTCLDPIARLKEIRISTRMFHSIRTGEAIHAILDAAEWPTSRRDIDYGVTHIPWWWLYDIDAYTALQQIVDSEGPPALATVDADGNLAFRDRHHRLLDAASTSVQATFRDGGAEPLFSAPAVYDHGLRDITNSVKFTVPVLKPAGQLSVVFSSQQRMSIDTGEVRQVTVKTSEPFINAVTPVAGTDFELASGSVTVTISPDSGQQATVSIQAIGGPAVIADLQVRALVLETASTYVVQSREAGSIKRYGRRNWPSSRDPVWASLPDVDAIADIIVGQYADRLPTITVTMIGGNDTRLEQQLSRDLSDRVHVVEAETGLDHDCFIETIEHSIGAALHTTRFGCEKAADLPTDVFRFDVAGAGFDDGKFGVPGRTDPAAMFLFDVAGQGFDDGLLAY